jgi:hypothetical protein
MKSYNKPYSCAIIIVLIIITGCNPAYILLKGKYEAGPSEMTSTKPVDSIWSNLIDLFSANGLVIKNIEKKKGLVVSAKTSFIPVYTFEDKDGQLQAPQAWVVLQKVIANKKEWNPKRIYGLWSIQITETGKGTTTIKIDPIVICTYFPNMFTSVETRGQSTGKLEELIKSSLKNDLPVNK